MTIHCVANGRLSTYTVSPICKFGQFLEFSAVKPLYRPKLFCNLPNAIDGILTDWAKTMCGELLGSSRLKR